MIITKTRQDLKEVLMEPRAPGLKEVYFIIKGESDRDIVVVNPGKNGNEFNKTFGEFSKTPGVEIVNVLYGQGVLIMQRNDLEDEAKEVKIVGLRAGVAIEIPAGDGFCFVNVGKTYLVVLGSSVDTEDKLSTEPVREKRGFAYYVVDKKGEVGFEPNPNYSIHPQIMTG